VLLILFLTNMFDLPPFVNTWADMRPMYHVTAPITFESVEKRSLCAPFDGQIKDIGHLVQLDKAGNPILDSHGQMIPILDSAGNPIPVLPGIIVPKGTPLFVMNTDDLVKQKSKSDSEMLYHRRRAAAYAADPTKTADGLAEAAQADEAKATSDLLASQIARATVVAPFEGEIQKGDLSDKKDVTVKEGEEQMEFGEPGNLRAALTVNERDIQDVGLDARGSLATTSKPLDKTGFTVTRIVPLGQPKEGSNVFTVYAKPDTILKSWRPGMAGEARVDVGKRTWAWIWSHRLLEFVRLKTWM
jgi:hypothetical protein